jgi:spore maturation protein CgeB
MKILLVAPTGQEVLGIITGDCKTALLNAGHEVKVFDFRESQYFKGNVLSYLKPKIKHFFNLSPRKLPIINRIEIDKMNMSLYNAVLSYKPDLALILAGETITTETLYKIRKEGIVTANWFMDSVYSPHRKSFVEEISPYYDFFFMIDSLEVLKYVKISAKYVYWLPLALDPALHKTVYLNDNEKQKYSSNVTFVGTVIPVREDILEAVANFGLNIWAPPTSAYGSWIDRRPTLSRSYRGGPIFGEEVVKIYNAAKIVISIDSLYRNQIFSVTPRVFEVAGCGSFHICNYNEQLNKLHFEIGKDIVCFNNKEDLRKLIQYYLENEVERVAVAINGQKTAYKYHSYAHRIEEMFSFLKDTEDIT